MFWAPAVGMDGEYTTDPEASLNFIYIVGRAGLEARVFRVESGGSLASNPLPHTRHLVTNVVVDSDGPAEVAAFANTQVVAYLRSARAADPQWLLRVCSAQGGRRPAHRAKENLAA